MPMPLKAMMAEDRRKPNPKTYAVKSDDGLK
jgi:hypothetical protein